MVWFRKKPKVITGTDVESREKVQKFISDGEKAEKLVNEYGRVLETTAGLHFGAPESLLPQSKDEIKVAIISYLLHLHAVKNLDRQTFDLLKVGYMQLATFIDDERARGAAAAVAATFSSGDPKTVAENLLQVDEKMEEVRQAIGNLPQINEEMHRLAAEFDSVMHKFEVNIKQ